MEVDVKSYERVSAIVEQAVEHFGRLDIMVIMPGYSWPALQRI